MVRFEVMRTMLLALVLLGCSEDAEKDRALRDYAKQRDARRAAEAERLAKLTPEERRAGMAADVEKWLLTQRVDSKVTASGTTLGIRWPLCSRLTMKDVVLPLDELRAAGFKRVECSDGAEIRAWLDL